MVAREVKLNGTSLPIREFKLSWFCENPSICMIAKRASGKSWVCRAIIKYFNFLPGGIIIAPTEKMNQFYGKFFPDIYIYYEYKSNVIERLLVRQDNMIEKCKKRYREGKKVDPRVFLIMDDCLSSKGTWINDKTIMDIFFNGRHFQLLFILTMQFPLGIKPEYRCNFDYIFLLTEDFYSNKKRLYEHYAGMFPSFESFRQIFEQLTDDYGCMVIVNRGIRKNFLDKVFWYKAKEDTLDNIGCDQFIEFHENNYDRNWKAKSKMFDISKYESNAKKKSKISVEKIHR
jgi:hypothetical protein